MNRNLIFLVGSLLCLPLNQWVIADRPAANRESTAGPAKNAASAEPGASPWARFDLVDFRGRHWTHDDFKDDSYVVVAFLGTECPLAKQYAFQLEAIAAEYGTDGVRVIGVMSNVQDSLEEIGAFASRQKITFPILKDSGNRFADQLSAERTPEVYVFDADRTLRYRGRVDDQYGIGYVLDKPRRSDLRIALDELTDGRDVSQPRTEAIGCLIGRVKKADKSSAVTYGGQVAEILSRRCVECHRDQEIAPFSLTEYEEVAGWADMIKEVVKDGRMPPWHATPDHADFANDRLLTDSEKETLYAWADAGAPAGDLSSLPKLPAKTEGWQLPRQPDLVYSVSPKPVEVQAEGEVRYKYYVVDPKLDHDVWFSAAELKPGNREVVHHILAFAVEKGQRRNLQAARGFLVGYVPGARVEPFPAGHAKKIPAGHELIFQVHYTPIGTPQTDHSQLGIVVVDPKTVTHEVVTTSAVQPRLRIPPNDNAYVTSAYSPRFPAESKLLGMSPHMHLRGKSFRYELEARDKTKTTVLDIPHYDFNWQTTYALKEPMSVPEGSRFFCTATFDNSDANLANPDPDTTVKWGDQTDDEMMIGYYHYAVPLAKTSEGRSIGDLARTMIRNAALLQRFDELDKDGDGELARGDSPANIRPIFDRLDKNGDGTLTRAEVSTAE